MRLKPGEIVCLLSRVMIGGVLLYAGFMKAIGPSAEFAAVLEAYKLFPPAVLSPFSLAVPYMEMWVGLFLLAGLYTRQAALASALLFTAFIIAVGSTLVRGIDLASCGCFGADMMSPRHTLALDVVMLMLSLLTNRLAKLPVPFSLDRAFP